jgi:hypothetical protein
MSWSVQFVTSKKGVLPNWDAYWARYTQHAPPPSVRAQIVDCLDTVSDGTSFVLVESSGHIGSHYALAGRPIAMRV